MALGLLIARLSLALVFGVAGLAKLADRAGSHQAVRDFGAPAAIAPGLALLLPLAELAVAAALIPTATAWWGALGASALLLLFIAAIAVNLARGRAPDCRCFGQLHSAPAGWPMLARNGVLAAVAATILVLGRDDPGRSAVAWMGGLTAAEGTILAVGLLALAVLAMGSILLLNLLRQNGRLLLRIEALERGAGIEGGAPDSLPDAPAGLPIGTPAPGFQLSGLYGETLTLDALRAAGKPVLLVLTDPNCGPCNALLPEISRWQRGYAGDLTIALITRGTAEENRAKSSEHGIINVLLQQDREVAEAYREQGTPAAVLVRADGTVGSSLASGADAIRSLAAAAARTPAAPPEPPPSAGNAESNGGAAPAGAPAGPRVGDPAPALRLPDVDGRVHNLAGFRGTKTLVLFWNPRCGFCAEMLDELRALDRERPGGAPRLLVVASGEEDEIRAMRLRSPVLVDQNFAVAQTFGAGGTPMAVLVDEKGRIASEAAAGAPAVMALARGDRPPPRGASAPAVASRGDPAPPLRLPDLEGRTVDLADFRGSRTLLVFWNPGCGFCRQMLDDLKTWEANRPRSAPELLVISAGSVDDNREMGFTSTVLLDPAFAAGAAFGANGTPSAVLIDDDGTIGSELAVGAPAVLALAGGAEARVT